jgi:hypothetical protein
MGRRREDRARVGRPEIDAGSRAAALRNRARAADIPGVTTFLGVDEVDVEVEEAFGYFVSVRRKGAWATFAAAPLVALLAVAHLAQGSHPGTYLAVLALGLAFSVLGWRVLRCSVQLVGDEVVVRNLVSTVTVPVGAVTAVEPRSWAAAHGEDDDARRVVLTTTGGSIRVDALNNGDPRIRVENAERLHQLLGLHR